MNVFYFAWFGCSKVTSVGGKECRKGRRGAGEEDIFVLQ